MPSSGSLVFAKSSRRETCAKVAHSFFRCPARVMYSVRLTVAHCAYLKSSSLRVRMMLNESIKASVGGGSSIEGMSAVGCAKNMVFPVIPFCCTSGLPLPRRTCFQHALPSESNVLAAKDASRTLWVAVGGGGLVTHHPGWVNGKFGNLSLVTGCIPNTVGGCGKRGAGGPPF